jgi:2-amino-4-hydroxy-6-hydroxymethyldihydropteridine diphosphokinase
MVIIGLGANLESPRHGPPRTTLTKALKRLESLGVAVVRQSRWYRSEPFPQTLNQPSYVNGVVLVETKLEPLALLATLHRVESEFGRARSVVNAARVIDLDLLAHGERVLDGDGPGEPILPHPRLTERAFVLRPLAEIAPDWRHPVTGQTVATMLAMLTPDQVVEPIMDA